MIAALIPAAGSSVRMGRPKLLFEFEGESLIGRVVRSLRQGGAERVVVVAPPANSAEGPGVADQALRAGAEVVVPHFRPAEMRNSIELGLERLAQYHAPENVLLTPGDYPGITEEVVARLMKCAAKAPDRIVIPSYDGRRGHPIVLPWKIATQIQFLPVAAGVNSLVAQYRDSVVELEVSSPEIIADLDTPADLHHWEQRHVSRRRTAGGSFRVHVRLFALAKDRAGQSELEIELMQGSTVADLRTALGDRVPSLGPLVATVMIAVDEEYASDDVTISPGSRLAVIPPVSGGAGRAALIRPSHSFGGGMSPR